MGSTGASGNSASNASLLASGSVSSFEDLVKDKFFKNFNYAELDTSADALLQESKTADVDRLLQIAQEVGVKNLLTGLSYNNNVPGASNLAMDFSSPKNLNPSDVAGDQQMINQIKREIKSAVDKRNALQQSAKKIANNLSTIVASNPYYTDKNPIVTGFEKRGNGTDSWYIAVEHDNPTYDPNIKYYIPYNNKREVGYIKVPSDLLH